MAEEERPERFRRPEAAPGTAFATERAVAGAEPAGKRLATELYLYGIIGPVAADWEPGTGVGDPPGDVFLIRYGNIAAVVSDVESGRLESEDPGALRQDMQAHYEVQGRVLPFAPLLPVRFGVALPNRDTARRMLAEHYEEFVDQLERLRGKVEVELRIRYREEPVIEELTREEPSLLPSRRWGHGSDRMTYAQRIELGESVMRALRTKKLQESHRVLAQLSPLVEIEKIQDGPEDELTMLEAAFLLDHRMLGAFEEEVEKLRERESDRVEVVCVGPLPAYSFVDQTVAV